MYLMEASMNKIFDFFFGSVERIIFWTTIGWTVSAIRHYINHDGLAYMGYVYIVLAVLTPTNFYLYSRKAERDKLMGK